VRLAGWRLVNSYDFRNAERMYLDARCWMVRE
jgi:hypothetical protein